MPKCVAKNTLFTIHYLIIGISAPRTEKLQEKFQAVFQRLQTENEANVFINSIITDFPGAISLSRPINPPISVQN